MNPTLARAVERLKQTREARRAAIAAELETAAAARGERGAHQIGDRVFDRIAGAEGVVIGRTTENVIVQDPKK